MTRRTLLAAIGAVVLVSASPGEATVHLMAIQEVFVGTPEEKAGPNAAPNDRSQYVMLRMTSFGQTVTTGSFLRVENADGTVRGTFGTLLANMGNGGPFLCGYPNCPAIVIGTQKAANMFTFTFDQVVDAEAGRIDLPVDGGRVCFVDPDGINVYDCVAWGGFDCTAAGSCAGSNTLRAGDTNAGNGCDSNYGTPAEPGGLAFGFALTRNGFSCAAKENSTDFSNVFPHPVNNAGANDNADGDGDNLIDQLDCADGDGTRHWAGASVTGVDYVGASKTQFSWDAQASTAGAGVTYDVVRGTLLNVANLTDAACSDPNVPTNSVTDGDVPPTGDGHYHLVRAGDGPAACVGSYGPNRSSVDPACP